MAARAFAIEEQMPTVRTILPFFLLAHSVVAWHDPVHELITRVALQSLPLSLRQLWAKESSNLTSRYCLYPDIYHNAEPAEKTRMKVFCEVGGRPIHNVTWKRGEDIQSLEYLLRNVADGTRVPEIKLRYHNASASQVCKTWFLSARLLVRVDFLKRQPMRHFLKLFLPIAFAGLLPAQTAEELVSRNLQAKGGIDKIKTIKSLRMTGKFQQGSFTAQTGSDALAPNMLRQTFTIQGMTGIRAYDGGTGWQISPFEGRKDPELLGEEDLREIAEQADFYGPLVDYQAKGNTLEYLGHDTVDGDDAHRLKVTLKNGDIFFYYLDPETFLEIRVEKIRFVRGTVRETFTEPGSYKLVAGIYFPFTLESGTKQSADRTKVIFEKIEANVAIDPQEFKMPAASPSGKEF
jgi:hypothetical protein